LIVVAVVLVVLVEIVVAVVDADRGFVMTLINIIAIKMVNNVVLSPFFWSSCFNVNVRYSKMTVMQNCTVQFSIMKYSTVEYSMVE